MIETERIYIRPIQHTDANAIFAYRSLERVAQYQYWEPFTVQKSLEFVVQNSCVEINDNGVWVGFAIILKSSNELIGDCALKIDGQKAELGCNISPEHYWIDNVFVKDGKYLNLFCQSCGMPMQTTDQFRTNADGSSNQEYCCYCYKNGAYTQNCTMEGMIEHCIQFLDEFNRACSTQYTKEEAIAQMKQFFPHLKRWKTTN